MYEGSGVEKSGTHKYVGSSTIAVQTVHTMTELLRLPHIVKCVHTCKGAVSTL